MTEPARRLQLEIEATKSLLAALQHELGDDPELRLDMVEGETQIFEAIDRVLAEIDEQEILQEGIVRLKQTYGRREGVIKDRILRLRGSVEQALLIIEADKPIRRPAATLSLAKDKPSLVIDDEAAIPSRFWKAGAPVLDKEALALALDAGEKVAGAHRRQGGVHVVIKR